MNINTLEREVQDAARRALAGVGEDTVERIRAKLPRDLRDGELARSIRYRISADERSLTFEATAAHAKYVEYGTTKQPARPFFDPAVQGLRERVEAALFGTVTDAIDKVLK